LSLNVDYGNDDSKSDFSLCSAYVDLAFYPLWDGKISVGLHAE